MNYLFGLMEFWTSSPTLSFKPSAGTIPAIHRHTMSAVSTCSRIALVDDGTCVQVRIQSDAYVPARFETIVDERAPHSSPRSTLALIEVQIVNYMDSSISSSADSSSWEAFVIGRILCGKSWMLLKLSRYVMYRLPVLIYRKIQLLGRYPR